MFRSSENIFIYPQEKTLFYISTIYAYIFNKMSYILQLLDGELFYSVLMPSIVALIKQKFVHNLCCLLK